MVNVRYFTEQVKEGDSAEEKVYASDCLFVWMRFGCALLDIVMCVVNLRGFLVARRIRREEEAGLLKCIGVWWLWLFPSLVLVVYFALILVCIHIPLLFLMCFGLSSDVTQTWEVEEADEKRKNFRFLSFMEPHVLPWFCEFYGGKMYRFAGRNSRRVEPQQQYGEGDEEDSRSKRKKKKRTKESRSMRYGSAHGKRGNERIQQTQWVIKNVLLLSDIQGHKKSSKTRYFVRTEEEDQDSPRKEEPMFMGRERKEPAVAVVI